MARMVKHFTGRSLLHNLSSVHHHDPFRKVCDDPKVVRYNHNRHPELIAQRAQKPQYLCLNGHVKRGGRLVRNQDLWIAAKRHRNHHALLHSS